MTFVARNVLSNRADRSPVFRASSLPVFRYSGTGQGVPLNPDSAIANPRSAIRNPQLVLHSAAQRTALRSRYAAQVAEQDRSCFVENTTSRAKEVIATKATKSSQDKVNDVVLFPLLRDDLCELCGRKCSFQQRNRSLVLPRSFFAVAGDGRRAGPDLLSLELSRI